MASAVPCEVARTSLGGGKLQQASIAALANMDRSPALSATEMRTGF